MIMDWIVALVGWWSSLSPAATFFFIIPLAVAVAGLVKEAANRR